MYHLVTPKDYYRADKNGVIFIYGVEYGCCFDTFKLDGINSNFTSMIDKDGYEWDIITTSLTVNKIEKEEYDRIGLECQKLMEWRADF